MAADGLITIPSSGTVRATLDRLESEVKARGITVFARIDHAAGAASAGLAMRPTELLIFGNAAAGTPLMQAAETIGIDLPLKALAWEDASGRVWLSYNDPGWLAHRHGLDASSAAATGAMTAMLASIAQKAAAAPSRTERLVGVSHRSIGGWTVLTALTSEPWLASVLNPCHRDLILCSIDLTRCSTDLIPCSVA